MGIIRATLLIGALLAASVLGILLYGNQEDQFVLSSGGSYVAVFDKKSKTMNVCDRENCNLIIPKFPSSDSPSLTMHGMKEKLSQFFNPSQGTSGQQLLGSFPPPTQQMPLTSPMNQPLMQMQQNTMPSMNPQMMQQVAPQMAPQMATPMMQQMPSQMMQPITPQMNPQPANNATPAAAPPGEATAPEAAAEEPTEETENAGEAKDGEEAAPEEAEEEAAPV